MCPCRTIQMCKNSIISSLLVKHWKYRCYSHHRAIQFLLRYSHRKLNHEGGKAWQHVNQRRQNMVHTATCPMLDMAHLHTDRIGTCHLLDMAHRSMAVIGIYRIRQSANYAE